MLADELGWIVAQQIQLCLELLPADPHIVLGHVACRQERENEGMLATQLLPVGGLQQVACMHARHALQHGTLYLHQLAA